VALGGQHGRDRSARSSSPTAAGGLLKHGSLSRIDLAGNRRCGYLPAAYHRVHVAETGRFRQIPLSGRDRLLAFMLGLGLLGLLAVAAFLKPDPRGLGTHQQFGLPPCTFRFLFGRPCPTCGMTTAWAHLVRGQLIGALRANVGGTLLGLLAMVSVPWLLVSAVRGRWLGWAPNSTVIACIGSAILLVTLIEWGIRLATG
jgi:hypothetical protein